MEITLAPTDQVLNYFEETNNSGTQQFNVGQPNPKPKGRIGTKERGKSTTTQRGRKKKEKGESTQIKAGKRPTGIELKKEEDGKKLKLGEDTSSDLVTSEQSLAVETSSFQSRRAE